MPYSSVPNLTIPSVKTLKIAIFSNTLQPSLLRFRRRATGFTLLEKMVIIAILGIVASIAAPGIFRILNRAKLKQTVAEVRTALNETQREAIRNNKICTVTLNFVDRKVTGSCLRTGDRNLAAEVAIATNLMGKNTSTSSDRQPRVVQSDTPRMWGLSNGSEPSLVAASVSSMQGRRPPKAAMVVQIISACKTVPSVSDQRNCRMSNAKGISRAAFLFAASPSPSSSPSPSPPPLKTPSSYDIPIRYGVLGNPVFFIESGGTLPTDPTGKIVFFSPDDQQAKKYCIAISNTLGLTRVGTYIGETTPLAITNSGRCKAEGWKQQ